MVTYSTPRMMVIVAILCLIPMVAFSATPPEKPVTIKIPGAAMAPVTFSHATHVDKAKVECKVCHHADADNPKACTTCHDAKQVKGKAPIAKDAFHNKCQPCHKDAKAKGVKAPTACNECHKK